MDGNRIWKGEGWKEGVVVPIIKKVGREGAEDYRRITLMPT